MNPVADTKTIVYEKRASNHHRFQYYRNRCQASVGLMWISKSGIPPHYINTIAPDARKRSDECKIKFEYWSGFFVFCSSIYARATEISNIFNSKITWQEGYFARVNFKRNSLLSVDPNWFFSSCFLVILPLKTMSCAPRFFFNFLFWPRAHFEIAI